MFGLRECCAQWARWEASRSGLALIKGKAEVAMKINSSLTRLVDFGFLELGMLAALPRVAKQGGKLPERLNGKVAVRVAMGYDAMANLHQQLGRVLAGLGEAAGKGRKGGG
jgi:hypothetical protein